MPSLDQGLSMFWVLFSAYIGREKKRLSEGRTVRVYKDRKCNHNVKISLRGDLLLQVTFVASTHLALDCVGQKHFSHILMVIEPISIRSEFWYKFSTLNYINVFYLSRNCPRSTIIHFTFFSFFKLYYYRMMLFKYFFLFIHLHVYYHK